MEPKPDVLYVASSPEIQPVMDKLRLEQAPLYNEMFKGKKIVVMYDNKDNNPVVVVGSTNSDSKFTPEAVLKDMGNGKYAKLQADDVLGQSLDMNAGKLSGDAPKKLQSSVDKKYRSDNGKEDVKITAELEKSVRAYATMRFTDLESGEVNLEKVEKFVKKYSGLVELDGMSVDKQKVRAKEIDVKIAEAQANLLNAATAALKEEKSPAPTDPTVDQFAPMRGAIDLALKIMNGEEQADNKLNESIEAAGGLLTPPATPKSAALSAAGTRKL
jgi:hypothetical protein